VIGVCVGGTGVRVGRGVFVRVGIGVFVGGGLEVGLAKITVAVLRGFLVIVGVMVTKCLCVSVGCGVRDAGFSVLVGINVSVGTNAVTTCSVSAAAVLKLETARFTRLIGSSVRGM
jgi:hypothetical protein